MPAGDPTDASIKLRPLEPASGQALARDLVLKTRRRKGLGDQIAVSKYLDDEFVVSKGAPASRSPSHNLPFSWRCLRPDMLISSDRGTVDRVVACCNAKPLFSTLLHVTCVGECRVPRMHAPIY